MTMIRIDDAPFTEEEKRKIKALGFYEVDWGHPDVQLEDPVAHFEEVARVNVAFGKPDKSDFETDRGPVVFSKLTVIR